MTYPPLPTSDHQTAPASGRVALWLGALPALVLGGFVLGATAWAATESDQERAVRYLALAKQAANENKHELVTMCYERLLQLGHPNSELLFGLARSLEAQGQTARAAAMLNDVAPPDRRGYAPAHLWIARQLMAASRPTPQARLTAEAHLLRALEGQLDDPADANLLLGELYLTAGQPDKARGYLEKVPSSAVAQLRLVQVAALKGETTLLRAKAEEVVRFFQAKVRQEPSLESARLYWAEAVMFLEDYEHALAILRDGQTLFPDSLRIRAAATMTYLAWLDALDREPKATATVRLAVLERALTHDPTDVTLLRRLWGLASAKGPEAERALEMLHGQLADGTNAGLAHLAIGTIAWENGRLAEGRTHMEQAFRVGPHVPAVANNLAWMLSHSDPPQFDRALEIIGRVVDAYPKEPVFRGTRGDVLAKMGRWKDAVPDLEALLAAQPNNAAVHALLAEAYSTLGDDVLSSLHRNWKSNRGKAADPAKPGARSLQ